MANNWEEDTEFNDALRKHGIIPAKEAPPPSPSPPPSPTLSDLLDEEPLSKLDGLEDDAADSDTERMMAAYRRKRMAEMQHKQKRGRFGEVYPIGRDDYSREVTEGSKADEIGEEGKELGTGVVCFLYRDGDPACVRLASQLRTLAARHSRTKFVSIIGNKCIPNYPDRLQPTLIIYRAGEMTNQVVSWGVDRERSLEDLETVLVASKAISIDDSKLFQKSSRKTESDDDGDDDDDRRLPSGLKGAGAKLHSSKAKSKNIRGPTVEDDDSDFDL